MRDPYTPTDYAADIVRTRVALPAKHSVQWIRIIVGGIALCGAFAVWSFTIGLLTSLLALEFATDRAGFKAAAIVGKCAYFVFSIAAYWWFTGGVRRWRLLHALLAWGLVQAIGAGILWTLLDISINYLAWDYWVLEVLPVCIGWALTRVWPGRDHLLSPAR